jgi:dihydropteroate synthase
MPPLREYHWPDGKLLCLGRKTLIMGILNVTPDSFSDGGRWNTIDRARRHAEEMIRDGADLIDIGAESSRPGFAPVPAAEELERLLPFLEKVVPDIPAPVSIDTFKSETATAALSCGVNIINDIQGLQYAAEPGQMAAVAAHSDVPVIVMHNQPGKEYSEDILAAMQAFFYRSRCIADQAGLRPENIIFDPGIGFGKTPSDNLLVLKRLEELAAIDGVAYPLLLGTSRKSFIGAALGLPVDERMEATGVTCVLGILKGASIVRVHDVKPIARMCRMTDAILQADAKSNF